MAKYSSSLQSNTEIDRVGKVTTESIFKCTGKHWHQWIAILEKAGARTWTHQEIVAFLKSKYKLGPWWQQGVTRGFEIVIGRRIEGQNSKGEYTLTATKSLHVQAAKVWKFLLSEAGQAHWLMPLSPVRIRPGEQFETRDGFFGEIRTLKNDARIKRIRMTWQDPNWEKHTVVQLMLVAKPAGKAILVFDQSQIQVFKTLAPLRKRWRNAAEGIAARQL